MMLVPLDKIIYIVEDRQRKELAGIEELASSIQTIAEKTGGTGLLHPIILDDQFKLIAGGRRLEAHKLLKRTEIEARFFSSLNETDKKLIELDENLRRVDITWQERCLAVQALHGALKHELPKQTAEYIGMDENVVRRYLDVASAIARADSKVLACTSIPQAIALLERRRALTIDTELSKIGAPLEIIEITSHVDEAGIRHETKRESKKNEVLNASFLEWAPSYTGPKFNFIHCDFPYGINFDSSASAGSERAETQYADDPDTFWSLVDCLFNNLDNIAYDSTHLMFWFSMKYYNDLMLRFKREGLFVHELPLIWHKSCGSGIASDYRRRPKHVYETALWASVGDRFISKVINDVYACPIAKETEGHLSAKPEPMLVHFLSMGVSDLTDFLDPTCGSGTSLRAAIRCGAAKTLGIEINEETAKNARMKLPS